MALEMRKSSKWWYGRYRQGGKAHCVNLKVEIKGTRPAAGQDGDGAFERSRGAAQEALNTLIAEVREKRDASAYVQRLHEIRTGRRIESIPLPSLASAWDKAPRKRQGSPRYVRQAHSLFARFLAFMAKTYPDAETLADVTPEMGEAFIQHDRSRGVSARTCNATLILLRSAFKALRRQANIVRNPFDGIPTLDEMTTHRKPFTPAERDAILGAAETDDFIGPVIVTGLYTAMRRGDCCTLRWGDVDLDEGFVRVKTSKTGEEVEIPLFPRLRMELEDRQPKGERDPDAYVFPEAAAMYLKNPDGITYRVRKVFEAAGFGEPEGPEDEQSAEPDDGLESLDEAELRRRVGEALAGSKVPQAMRERQAAIFAGYMEGETVPTLAHRLGISKSTVSLDLHRLEKAAGGRIVSTGRKQRSHRGVMSVKPAGGKRRVSVRDFHSFRVTWITLALSAGVPLELVQRVTGHKTTQVVLKHYFKPGRDAFKKAIEGAMPELLAGHREIQVVAEEGEGYAEVPGPGELLERALDELAAVKCKSKRLTAAVALVEQAKAWLDGRVIREVEA